MRNFIFAGAIAAVAIIGVQPASAAVFDFTFSGTNFVNANPIDVTGTLTTNSATPISANPQLITGITGTDNGAAITGLEPAGSYLSNDNLLYYPAGSGTLVDSSGFSFSTASLTANIFTQLSGYFYTDTNGATSVFSPSTFTVTPASTPVPEPGSLTLLGTGVLGLILVMRRNRQTI